MDINLGSFFKKKTVVGTHNTYGLTQLGKTKAEEFALDGPKWEVLAMLDENGPSTIQEISDETHLSTDKVRRILRDHIKSGYVHRTSQEE